jgi:hypothetical protein
LILSSLKATGSKEISVADCRHKDKTKTEHRNTRYNDITRARQTSAQRCYQMIMQTAGANTKQRQNTETHDTIISQEPGMLLHNDASQYKTADCRRKKQNKDSTKTQYNQRSLYRT